MGSYQEGTSVGMWFVMMAIVVMLGMVDRMVARPQLFQVETDNKEGLVRSFLTEIHVGGRNPVITEITTEPLKEDAKPQTVKEVNQDYSEDDSKEVAGAEPEPEDVAMDESKPEEDNNETKSKAESDVLSAAGSNHKDYEDIQGHENDLIEKLASDANKRH